MKKLAKRSAKRASKADVENIITRTVEQMKELGTYKESYDDTIRIYAELLGDYRIAYEMWEDTDRQPFLVGPQGGVNDNPLPRQLRQLRSQIGEYSDRLQLNPKSYKHVVRVNDGVAVSPLDAALNNANKLYR